MLPGIKVLIVEDEPELAKCLAAYLRRGEAQVKAVHSGEAAVAVAREFLPDVLILDYRLPGINGLETFAKLRDLPIRHGCIMITGDSSEDIPRAARAAGIRRVLKKPFLFSELEGTFITPRTR
ncbi:MAG: response regulator [Betaproteobacteria bacterium]|nr:response regulator [Betaproteobacteria bacterium]